MVLEIALGLKTTRSRLRHCGLSTRSSLSLGLLIKTGGDGQILTGKNPATALFHSVGDPQSDTLPP